MLTSCASEGVAGRWYPDWNALVGWWGLRVGCRCAVNKAGNAFSARMQSTMRMVREAKTVSVALTGHRLTLLSRITWFVVANDDRCEWLVLRWRRHHGFVVACSRAISVLDCRMGQTNLTQSSASTRLRLRLTSQLSLAVKNPEFPTSCEEYERW